MQISLFNQNYLTIYIDDLSVNLVNQWGKQVTTTSFSWADLQKNSASFVAKINAIPRNTHISLLIDSVDEHWQTQQTTKLSLFEKKRFIAINRQQKNNQATNNWFSFLSLHKSNLSNKYCFASLNLSNPSWVDLILTSLAGTNRVVHKIVSIQHLLYQTFCLQQLSAPVKQSVSKATLLIYCLPNQMVRKSIVIDGHLHYSRFIEFSTIKQFLLEIEHFIKFANLDYLDKSKIAIVIIATNFVADKLINIQEELQIIGYKPTVTHSLASYFIDKVNNKLGQPTDATNHASAFHEILHNFNIASSYPNLFKQISDKKQQHNLLSTCLTIGIIFLFTYSVIDIAITSYSLSNNQATIKDINTVYKNATAHPDIDQEILLLEDGRFMLETTQLVKKWKSQAEDDALFNFLYKLSNIIVAFDWFKLEKIMIDNTFINQETPAFVKIYAEFNHKDKTIEFAKVYQQIHAFIDKLQLEIGMVQALEMPLESYAKTEQKNFALKVKIR